MCHSPRPDVQCTVCTKAMSKAITFPRNPKELHRPKQGFSILKDFRLWFAQASPKKEPLKGPLKKPLEESLIKRTLKDLKALRTSYITSHLVASRLNCRQMA